SQAPTQDQIRTIYQRCDVWLCSSRQEGFCLPILESMACGCPVVSTRVGGAADLVRNGVNGFSVNIDDSRTLADRAANILAMQHQQRAAMREAAIATALAYSWDDAAKLMETALESISGDC